ncbi:hypothetical protein Trydic_g3716 [Trypoxylus dichotomus]
MSEFEVRIELSKYLDKKEMDLSKMTNDKKLELCRHYFKAGFALLPFVWAVNAIWFFGEAFRKDKYDEQPQIKRYVIYSAIGSIVWSIIIAIWVVVFQVNRVGWAKNERSKEEVRSLCVFLRLKAYSGRNAVVIDFLVGAFA